MVKIVDKTDTIVKQKRICQSMLEKVAMMFGADCVKHNPLLPFIITVYNRNKENPQPVAHIDLQFSRMALYDPNPYIL